MANVLQKMFNQGSKSKNWRTFVLIMLLAIAGAFVDVGAYYNHGVDLLATKTNDKVRLPHTKEIPFRLGLDLQGGTHLVYQADVSKVDEKDKASAVEGVRDVIERRVNVFGVSEPVVQTNRSGADYQVIVELAGIKNVSEAIKMIGETPLLEFKEKGAAKTELSADDEKKITDSQKLAEQRATNVLGKILSGGDFSELAKEFSDDTNTKTNGGDMGWITESSNPEEINLVSKLAVGKTTDVIKATDGYVILKLDGKQDKKNPFSDDVEKEVKAAHILICYKGADSCTSDLDKTQAYEKIKKLKQIATPANFAKLAKENSTEPGADKSGGELGWFGKNKMVKPFEDTVFSQAKGTISYVVETKYGYHLIYKEDERTVQEYKVSKIYFKALSDKDLLGEDSSWVNTELTGSYLKRAVVQFDNNSGAPEVSLEFNDQGAKLFEDLTAKNVGKQVAIFLDGYVISAPTVNTKISGGKAVIQGSFNVSEAKLLAQRLNTGALPVPITLVNQQVVGPSLGQKSVTDSLLAGMIGFALVAAFMILYYRLPGVLSVLALTVYTLLVLAVFKLWPVTLTLSGLAGFILSIGMAVDANVLIFERVKEELRNSKPLGLAIDEGFKRAWPSIRDSNTSSLLTCLILYIFYTGTIRGFAITLALGIIVSMFSAITITRVFLKLLDGAWLAGKTWLFGVSKKTN